MYFDSFIEKTKFFAPNSKFWIFFGNRSLSKEEGAYCHDEIQLFLTKWNTHDIKINASYTIVFDQIILITADESKFQISGCAIDSLNNCIEKINEKLCLDLFQRKKLYYLENEELKHIELDQIATLHSIIYNLKVFNPFYTNLQDFRSFPIQNMDVSKWAPLWNKSLNM